MADTPGGADMAKRTCSIDGCAEPHFGRGFCKRHYNADYHRRNREEQQRKQAEYRARHREEARERARQWRQENPDRVRAANRQWYSENADRVLEYRRRYRDENREQIREHNRKRKVLERGASLADFTPDDWERIKAAFDHRCAYCGEHFDDLTRDHVVPLSKGGAHHPDNVVPACRPCNASKGDGPAPPMVVHPDLMEECT